MKKVFNKKKLFTASDVEKPLGAGWSIWFYPVIRPLAKRISLFLANKTNVSPNQITVFSFLIGLSSAFCFFQGQQKYLIIGAVLFEISFLFDCVDGTIARLKKMESGFGCYLDSMLDQIRIFFVVLCLTYGQYLLTKDISYFLLGMAYIFLYLIQWVSRDVLSYVNKNFFKKEVNSDNIYTPNKFSFIRKISPFFKQRGISIVPGFMEADAIAFFIFPILLRVKWGLFLGSIVLFFGVLMRAYIFFKIKHSKET